MDFLGKAKRRGLVDYRGAGKTRTGIRPKRASTLVEAGKKGALYKKKLKKMRKMSSMISDQAALEYRVADSPDKTGTPSSPKRKKWDVPSREDVTTYPKSEARADMRATVPVDPLFQTDGFVGPTKSAAEDRALGDQPKKWDAPTGAEFGLSTPDRHRIHGNGDNKYIQLSDISTSVGQNESDTTKSAMVEELAALHVLSPAQLAKLADVSDTEAVSAYHRYQRLEKEKPSMGQVGRGTAIGATLGPAAAYASRAIAGTKATGLKHWRGPRDLAASALVGGVTGGIVPAARHHVEKQHEMGTLKKYIKERSQPSATPKLAADRATKEVRRALAAGNTETAGQIAGAYRKLELKPRYVKDISGGGQEAAVDLLMGAYPSKPGAPGIPKGGFIARKLYKPDSPITQGHLTEKNLQLKQQMTDAARALPGGSQVVPEMYGYEALPGKSGPNFISYHEHVPGIQELPRRSRDRVLLDLERQVIYPLRREGFNMHDTVSRADTPTLAPTDFGVPRKPGFFGGLQYNPGNVVVDAKGQPKIVDFLPEIKGNFPARDFVVRQQLKRLFGGKATPPVASAGYDIQALRKNIFQGRSAPHVGSMSLGRKAAIGLGVAGLAGLAGYGLRKQMTDDQTKAANDKTSRLPRKFVGSLMKPETRAFGDETFEVV
jgi:hypothetical protein